MEEKKSENSSESNVSTSLPRRRLRRPAQPIQTVPQPNRASRIQSLVDEHKMEIGDGLYKKLCDILLEEYKEEKKDSGLYKIRYIKPKLETDTTNFGMGEYIGVVPYSDTCIGKLSNTRVEVIKELIRRDGFCCICSHEVFMEDKCPPTFVYPFIVRDPRTEDTIKLRGSGCTKDLFLRQVETLIYYYDIWVISIEPL